MDKFRIGIGIVHNKDENRLKPLLKNMEQLKSTLANKFIINYEEFSWQPEIVPHSLITVFKRNFLYWKLGRKWTAYRNKKNKNLIYSFLHFIYTFSKKCLNKPNMYKASFIETLVTNKHIALWEKLVEHNDIIVIFEDDVVFVENSITRMQELLEFIFFNNLYMDNLYIDLAGGCSLNELQIDNLYESCKNGLIKYKKMVTNTACGYLMSAKLVEKFLKYLIIYPTFRTIGVDWMMNQLAIVTEKNHIYIECYHCNPTIFKHGSITGEYLPWER